MLIWYLDCSSSKWIIFALICLISQNSGGLLTYILGSGGANFHVSVWFLLILRQLHFLLLERPVLGLSKTKLFLLTLFLLLLFCSSFTGILGSLPPSVNWQPTERLPWLCRHTCCPTEAEIHKVSPLESSASTLLSWTNVIPYMAHPLVLGSNWVMRTAYCCKALEKGMFLWGWKCLGVGSQHRPAQHSLLEPFGQKFTGCGCKEW